MVEYCGLQWIDGAEEEGGGKHLYNQTLYIDSIVTESKQSLAHFPFLRISSPFSLGLARRACMIIVFGVLFDSCSCISLEKRANIDRHLSQIIFYPISW